jgi:VWFA-related protein
MRRCVCALMCFYLTVDVFAQTAAPTIRTGTQIVVVDVSVTDSHGNAIHNLKQLDFAVLEGDSAQAITHFEEHAAPTAAELARLPAMPKLEPNTYTNFTVVPENSPINVLLIDNLNTPIDGQANTRRQLVSFLGKVKPGTRIAIFGLSTHLFLLQGLTSDPRKLLSAMNSGKSNPQSSSLVADPLGTVTLSDETSKIAGAMGNDPTLASMVENMQQMEMVQAAQADQQRAVRTLDAMNQLARYLSGLPGRKNLIWFSASFPINILPNPDMKGSQDPFSVVQSAAEEFRATTSLLARSQVAVYPVDSRGLFTAPMTEAVTDARRYGLNPNARDQDQTTFSTQTMSENSTMRRMAEATGGHAYINTNNLSEAVEKAIDSGSNYYTLVYSPSNKKWDGGFRKISVHLTQGNYTLAYRKGYYADMTVAERQSQDAEGGKDRSGKSAKQPKGGAVTGNDAMRTAMQRGAPDPTEIIFKALVVASAGTSGTVAAGNVASPRSKPPYRVVTVAYAINPGDITMPPGPDGARHVNLDFITVVYDREGQVYTQQTNNVNVFAKPEGYREFLKGGVTYQQQIAVPAKGEFYLWVGVHDLIGDKIGAIEVPAAGVGSMGAAGAAGK